MLVDMVLEKPVLPFHCVRQLGLEGGIKIAEPAVHVACESTESVGRQSWLEPGPNIFCELVNALMARLRVE